MFATGQHLPIISLTYITATRLLCSLSHTLRPDEIQKTCPPVNSLCTQTTGTNLTFYMSLNLFHLKTAYGLHFCMLQVAVAIPETVDLLREYKSLASAGTVNLSKYLSYNFSNNGSIAS